jgi:hypothetical protein
VVVVDNDRPVGMISRGNLLNWIGNWVVARFPADVEGWLADLGPDEYRRRIDETMAALARTHAGLADRLKDRADDFVPCVVGAASKMQDLIDNLLSHCQRQITA